MNTPGKSRPTGTVTFLFTDIEGSTKLALEYADAWESARARHHAILQHAIESNCGYVFQIVGDAFSAAFHTTDAALRAAISSQIDLNNQSWKKSPIKVRMGIHTGNAQLAGIDPRSGGYIGYIALTLTQRVMSIGHGGQILLSNASAELTRRELLDQATLQDLGKHYLKGFPNPEQIWQVNAPSLLHDFPPLQSLRVKSNNLPFFLTSFVGREKEIFEIRESLAAHRLVTLIGPGGTGKTRLSIQAAQDLLDQFSDGVWFVELAPILDPGMVPRTTAITIGLRDEPQRPVIDMLCDYLCGKQMLLILDNCEHLIGACAQMADKILQAAPELRILASSREALGITGETTYRVPSLGLPEPDLLSVEALTKHGATKLFIDRATSALSTFSVTDANASAVAQICRRLDGIPLAIELAAAKVRALSPEQIAKRLDDRFRLLTGGSRTAMERHQTLRAAIDWGYNLLQPAEQALCRRLSVFVDGWTLEAAESVCGDGSTARQDERVAPLSASSSVLPSDVLPLLEQLINKSFVVREENGREARYRMLETIRQYANEKLIEANEGDPLRNCHLKYFLSLAETAAPHLTRPEQLEWLAQLDAEYQNLRAAFDWAVTKSSPASALRLCSALAMFWFIRGYWLEGSTWLSSAIALCLVIQTEEEKAAYAQVRYWDAYLAWACDDRQRAKLSANLSLTLAQERTDPRDIALARFIVGLVHFQNENNQVARVLTEQSMLEFQELQDAYWEARAYDIYGRSLTALGELQPSERIMRKYELARKAGERNHLADALFMISIWHYTYNRFDEAQKYAAEADLLWKQTGVQVNSSSMTFALIAWSNGDYERAKVLYAGMRDRFGWQGERYMRSGMVACLGKLAMEEGDLVQAQIYLEQALATVRELDVKSSTVFRNFDLGILFLAQGDLGRFKQAMMDGLSLRNHLDDYARFNTLTTFLESRAIQSHPVSIQLLGALHAFETQNERPFRIMQKVFLLDQALLRAREKFGDAMFESAFAEGQNMSLGESLDLVLKTVDEM